MKKIFLVMLLVCIFGCSTQQLQTTAKLTGYAAEPSTIPVTMPDINDPNSVAMIQIFDNIQKMMDKRDRPSDNFDAFVNKASPILATYGLGGLGGVVALQLFNMYQRYRQKKGK